MAKMNSPDVTHGWLVFLRVPFFVVVKGNQRQTATCFFFGEGGGGNGKPHHWVPNPFRGRPCQTPKTGGGPIPKKGHA